MIKINLCPVDELEFPVWYRYLPEISVFVVVLGAAFVGVQYYFGTIEEQIQVAQMETAEKVQATASLDPDIKKFKDLGQQIEALKQKITALQSITVSKIARYRPVIATEHLQNLKPDGVWFRRFSFGSKESPDGFALEGSAFDNILVAEFMTAMRATESQEKDEADLRTQVYFADLNLEKTMLLRDADSAFPDLKNATDFHLKGSVRERTEAVTPVPASPPAEKKKKDGAKAPPPVDVSKNESDESRLTEDDRVF